jgi:hypothetical protein
MLRVRGEAADRDRRSARSFAMRYTKVYDTTKSYPRVLETVFGHYRGTRTRPTSFASPRSFGKRVAAPKGANRLVYELKRPAKMLPPDVCATHVLHDVTLEIPVFPRRHLNDD